jgi:hypothetical protein
MKMTLEDLRGFYPQRFRRTWADPTLKGSPDLYTPATAKGHIHKVNPAAKPSKGVSSHQRRRREAWHKFGMSLKG